MAVPLIEKGVVVVAVGYDIAPKGKVVSSQLVLISRKQNMSTFYPGNMDLMVSQVRRSVVSIVQQYSHIRWAFLSLLNSSRLLPPEQVCLCFLMNPSFFFCPLSGVFTCVATRRGLTWLPWSCPLTGHNIASILKSKVGSAPVLTLPHSDTCISPLTVTTNPHGWQSGRVQTRPKCGCNFPK